MIKRIANFVRFTIAGGILFLVPVIVIIIVLTKAFGFTRGFSKAIADKLSFKQVAGVGVSTLISIIVLLMICFIAGIFMKTTFAQRIVKWLEDRILIYIPGYSYIRARSTDWFSSEKTSNWKPASIFVDDNEVICFVIDETEDYCSIFLPSAPTPTSGSICVRKKNMVTFLPINITQAVSMIRQFGKGASVPIQQIKPKHDEERHD